MGRSAPSRIPGAGAVTVPMNVTDDDLGRESMAKDGPLSQVGLGTKK